MAVLSFSDTILLRSLWAGGFMDKSMMLKISLKLVVHILSAVI